MAKEAKLQLFLNKFIEVNQTKYADNPEVLALLEGLTLADINFTRIEKDETLGEGGRIADFESEERKFNAIDQQWICALLGAPGIVDTIDDTVHADLTEILATEVPGLYRMTSGSNEVIVVVLEHATMTTDEIKTAIFTAVAGDCAFSLEDKDFVWPEGELTVGTSFTPSVVTDTIESQLVVAWLPEANTGGGGTDPDPEEPGTGGDGGGETDPGTGGGEEGGGTGPEDELPQPPAKTPEEEALDDVTGGGTYAAPGEPGFGILTDERTVTTESATITTATPVASFAMPYFTAPSA